MTLNKTYLLLFIVFLAVGFTAYSYRTTILNSLSSLTTTTQQIITKFQSTITQIQTAWSTLPSTIQSIVLLGIPTAFATFFAWTKSRAMQKLQQTQQQATQQIGSLNTQMQSVEAERDVKIGELEAQLATAQNSTGLQSSLSEAQKLVTAKQQEMHDLQISSDSQIQTLKDQVQRLEDQLRVKQLVK